MERVADYLSVDEAAAQLGQLAAQLRVTEFARVPNLSYVFSPYDLYPLAPRVRSPLDYIVAFAVDMDGTSTTTEPLALHALEYMVRRLTGWLERERWPGLDERLDVPLVVGNSNFRHAEVLVQRYRAHIDWAAFSQAFLEALVWTLACMPDAQRRTEIRLNAQHCGLKDLLLDPDFARLIDGGQVTTDNVGELVRPLLTRFGPAFRPTHEGDLVAAALDIYYFRYHSILQRLERGEGRRLAAELGRKATEPLVGPMPGYDLFVPLIKGWLGPEIDSLYEPLRDHLLRTASLGHTPAELDSWRGRLVDLADRFRRRPAKLALVTASIAYEAQACMRVVLDLLRQRVEAWPVPAECRERIAQRLGPVDKLFDAFVTATDACEPRLKPHRDLYSLALFQMSVPSSDYGYCVGLEDSEPGIIALRAAGVGCAVALPNHETRRQDYAAAAEVVRGGLPELILARNLLLGPTRDNR